MSFTYINNIFQGAKAVLKCRVVQKRITDTGWAGVGCKFWYLIHKLVTHCTSAGFHVSVSALFPFLVCGQVAVGLVACRHPHSVSSTLLLIFCFHVPWFMTTWKCALLLCDKCIRIQSLHFWIFFHMQKYPYSMLKTTYPVVWKSVSLTGTLKQNNCFCKASLCLLHSTGYTDVHKD